MARSSRRRRPRSVCPTGNAHGPQARPRAGDSFHQLRHTIPSRKETRSGDNSGALPGTASRNRVDQFAHQPIRPGRSSSIQRITATSRLGRSLPVGPRRTRRRCSTSGAAATMGLPRYDAINPDERQHGHAASPSTADPPELRMLRAAPCLGARGQQTTAAGAAR